ncbi:MAG: sugar ABC transporter periplasmic protein [Parcubacteria group bacterium Gr01-1014_8]|nr:MAG: sugar ABC transporter periplasmic protein [Parcubacteria group bacterium Gr01-1014_8]
MTKLSFFQIVVLSSFGALAIAGVMIFAFVVGGSGGEGIGEVKIWGTLDAGAFATILRQLAEEDTRMKAVTYTQKDQSTFDRDVTNALASGAGPDLFVLRSDFAEKEAAKVSAIPYALFSEEQFQNTFIEAANVYMGPEGVRAVPLVVDPLVLYWNRDMLASSGFAKPPVFWDELFDMATKMTKKDDTNSIIKSTIALGEHQNVDHAKEILSLLIMQAQGRITQRDGTGKLQTALVARAGDVQQPTESALRYYTEFANPIKAHYTWNRALRESRSAFASGDLALYIGLASEEPLVRRINPNLNFAIAPVPQIRGGARSLNVGHVYAFAVPKAAKNLQGALTVAYTLASMDTSKLFSKALGMPSARRDVLAEPATGNDDLFNKQAILARAWVDPDPEKTDVIFRDMIQSVTSGSARLGEAIQRADKTMSDLLSI